MTVSELPGAGFDVYCHPSCTGKDYKAWGPVEKRNLGSCNGFRYKKSIGTGEQRAPMPEKKGSMTAEFMMPRALYGRRTSSKPSHTPHDIMA